MRLFDTGGAEVGSTITDAAGRYSFVGLTPGNYCIGIAIPDGFAASPQDQGSDDTADSDIDATGGTKTTTLDPGGLDRNWDSGLVPVS